VTFRFGTASQRQSARLGLDPCEGWDADAGAGAHEGASANWGVVGGGWKKERTELAVLSKLILLLRIALRIMFVLQTNEIIRLVRRTLRRRL